MNKFRLPLFWLLIIIFSIISSLLHSQIHSVAEKRFHYDSFTTKEGLYTNNVYDIFVDKYDNLYATSFFGVQVFNGMNFQEENLHPNSNSYLSSLQSTDNEKIFRIVGGGLYMYSSQNDSFELLTSHIAFTPDQSTRVFLIYEDETTYYFVSKNNILEVCKYENYRVYNSEVSFSFFLKVTDFRETSKKSVLMDSLGYIYRYDHIYNILPTGLKLDIDIRLSAVAMFNDTILYIKDEGIYQLVLDKTIQPELMYKLPFNISLGRSNIHFSSEGHCFLSVNNRVFKYNILTHTIHYELLTMEGNQFTKIGFFNALKSDSYGNLYLSTLNEGVIRIQTAVETFDYIGLGNSELSFAKVMYVCEKENKVLSGSFNSGLVVYDTMGLPLIKIEEFKGSKKPYMVTAIEKHAPNEYLIFLLLDPIPYLLTFKNNHDYLLRPFSEIRKHHYTYYSSKYKISENEYVINSSNELVFCDKYHKKTNRDPLVFKSNTYASNVRDDLIVLGFNEMLILFHWKTDSMVTISLKSVGLVRSIAFIGENEILVGCDKGLHLINIAKGKIVASYWHDVCFFSVVNTLNKGIWCGTNKGLLRFENEDFTFFTKYDGLQDNEFNTNAYFMTEKGKLYMGGISGITAFYPFEGRKNYNNPIPFLRKIYANNKMIYSNNVHVDKLDLVMKPQINNFNIHFGIKGPKPAHEYSLSYKINEESAMEVSKDFVLNAYMAGGDYNISYWVGNSYNEDASLKSLVKLKIDKIFYQKWWFITLVLLMILFVIFSMLYTYRSRTMIRIANQQKLIEQINLERHRISRDLHDHIGVEVTMMRRRINHILENISNLHRLDFVKSLKTLEEQSQRVNQELRNTIWLTKKSHVSVSEFTDRIKTLVHALRRAFESVNITVVEDIHFEKLFEPMEVLNLFRICQEALHNITKHAEASHIKVHICCKQKNEIEISIEDNGKGFDLETLLENEGGISNMKKRASDINYKFTIEGEPGKGTRILVSSIV